MRLYKCDEFNEKKCKDYEGCNCKYTFDPRHIWKGHAIIDDWVRKKTQIEVQSDGCPSGKDTCFLSFYKDKEES